MCALVSPCSVEEVDEKVYRHCSIALFYSASWYSTSGLNILSLTWFLHQVEKRVPSLSDKEEAIEDLSVRDNIEPYFTNLGTYW